MCVYSMIVDHHWDKWKDIKPLPFTPSQPYIPAISPLEIEEFRKLLERAREYDKKNNEPDCELEEKKERIRKLAKDLNIKIHFI